MIPTTLLISKSRYIGKGGGGGGGGDWKVKGEDICSAVNSVATSGRQDESWERQDCKENKSAGGGDGEMCRKMVEKRRSGWGKKRAI